MCKRCVMDTSDPEITFDEKGNCNHCDDFFKKYSDKIYLGEESDKQLEIILNKIKKSKLIKPIGCRKISWNLL